MLTDDALASSVDVRLGFTARRGGSSLPPYASLNLAAHVEDDIACVQENRRRVMAAIGCAEVPVIVPNQVHGTEVVRIDGASSEALDAARTAADAGADSLIVTVPRVAAMLCFADCASVVMVAPDGRFCVAHAGWRGAVAGIVGISLSQLCAEGKTDPSQVNIYVGPHIRQECFEVSAEIAQQFLETYGPECVPDTRHVSLFDAVRLDALAAGAASERIADAGICTRCHADTFFSYRASGGVCGRHGAFAVRMK